MMAKRMFSRPKAKIRVTAAFWLERLRSMPEASRSMAPARARAETPGIYTTASCRSSQKITATASRSMDNLRLVSNFMKNLLIFSISLPNFPGKYKSLR